MTRFCGFAAVLGVSLALLSPVSGSADAPEPGGESRGGQAHGTPLEQDWRDGPHYPRLLDKTKKGETVRVILGLDVGFTPEGMLRDKAAVADQRSRLRRVQDEVFTGVEGLGAELITRYQFIPFMALSVDSAALEALAAFPEVTSIEEDVPSRPFMASSNPVIGSPAAWSAGFTGAGQTVAVLDSGVDKTHPFFATLDKVVSEACYSTTSGEYSSLCPGGSNSTQPGSGVSCTGLDGCDHGTHVAGTVAGDDTVGPNFGVARGARIIAIQVFSRRESVLGCYPEASPCLRTLISDQIRGLERVAELAGSFDIAAVNMSLGGGQYFDQASCDVAQTAMKAAIDSLRGLEIATVVATGNSGFADSMSAPACISTAVSVGATTDSDLVAYFSNIASFVSLLAPGVSIDSSVPGGGVAGFDGTSMAAPHVAGAWAVLRQKHPALSVADALAAFQSTGSLVDDERPGGVETGMPRLNVDLALSANDGCLPDAFEPDGTPGQGKAIASGASQLRSICPVGDDDWALFSLPPTSASWSVTVETSGPDPGDDTRLWLRDASLEEIEYDDDIGLGNRFSLIERSCGVDALPPGSYLVEVDEYFDNDEIDQYALDLTYAPCDEAIFEDGFESGNNSAWSASIP